MAHLAEHIAVLETELAVMTRDGHHGDAGIARVMKQLDTVCMLFNQRRREINAENHHPRKPTND
jgi:hypothetical protein